MFKITKTFDFSAAHFLPFVADDHPCKRMHGHNYEVTVEFAGPLDARQFVIDFNDLKPLKEWLDETFDHKLINDTISSPTSEILAQFIAEAILYGDVLGPNVPEFLLQSVTVSETPKTSATWFKV